MNSFIMATIIAHETKAYHAKKKIVMRALGNPNPLPPPSHLSTMLDMYDTMWIEDRSSMLVDEALIKSFRSINATRQKIGSISHMIINTDINLSKKRSMLQEAMILLEDAERKVLLMESVTGA